MNTDPFAIRRSDNPAAAESLIAQRRAPRTDEALSHAALCVRIERNTLFKGMIRDMEISAVANFDDAAQQECDQLVDRLRTGAL